MSPRTGLPTQMGAQYRPHGCRLLIRFHSLSAVLSSARMKYRNGSRWNCSQCASSWACRIPACTKSRKSMFKRMRSALWNAGRPCRPSEGNGLAEMMVLSRFDHRRLHLPTSLNRRGSRARRVLDVKLNSANTAVSTVSAGHRISSVVSAHHKTSGVKLAQKTPARTITPPTTVRLGPETSIVRQTAVPRSPHRANRPIMGEAYRAWDMWRGITRGLCERWEVAGVTVDRH